MKWDESQHPRDPDGKFARKFSHFGRPSKEPKMESPKRRDDFTFGNKITQRDYDVTFSPVHLKIGIVRKTLDREGTARTVVYTLSHIYFVEIKNEEGYPYTILKKMRIE